jgi:hypothetical protein
MNATVANQHGPARLSPAELRSRWQRMLEDPLGVSRRRRAIEVWLVAEDGTIEMLNERGRVAASRLGIAITPPHSLTII